MAYLTAAELQARRPAADVAALLADIAEGDRDAFIDDVLDEVSQELDGYAEARYAIPLAATAQVKRLVDDLAWFALERRRNWNWSETEQKAEEELRKRLASIAARKYGLTGQVAAGSTDNATSIRATDPSARTSGRARQFTRDSLKGF